MNGTVMQVGTIQMMAVIVIVVQLILIVTVVQLIQYGVILDTVLIVHLLNNMNYVKKLVETIIQCDFFEK